MKTHDESKCGMECIRTNAERICVKPEKGQCPRCEQIVEESLVHIHRLESTYSQVSKALCSKENATLDELLTAVDQLKNDLQYTVDAANVMKDEALKLEQRLAQVEKERDAAVSDLEVADKLDCQFCVHNRPTPGCEYDCEKCENKCTCNLCRNNDKNEWRGPCPENTQDPAKE